MTDKSTNPADAAYGLCLRVRVLAVNEMPETRRCQVKVATQESYASSYILQEDQPIKSRPVVINNGTTYSND